jgi:hypothetical protein
MALSLDCIMSPRCQFDQYRAGFDLLAGQYAHGGDGAGGVRGDAHFHFHGFDHGQGLPGRHRVAGGDFEAGYGAGHGRAGRCADRGPTRPGGRGDASLKVKTVASRDRRSVSPFAVRDGVARDAIAACSAGDRGRRFGARSP